MVSKFEANSRNQDPLLEIPSLLVNARFQSVTVQSLAVPIESKVFHTISLNRPNMGESTLGLNAHSVSNGKCLQQVTILKYSACQLEQLR